jgi:hypothetical protein
LAGPLSARGVEEQELRRPPRLWSVAVGEIGNLAFSAEFESFAEYGKCYDALSADPVFQAWRAKNQESGVSEWVRSNLLREIKP